MNRLIKNTDSWSLKVKAKWWMHVIESLHGKVLLAGDFDKDLLEYLSQFCQVHSVLNANTRSNQAVNARYVSLDESKNLKYSAIIINSFDNDSSFDSTFLTHFYNNCLETEGRICVLEKNRGALKSGQGNLLSKLFSLFSIPGPLMTNITEFSNITRVPTICYEGEPQESFLEGAYSSNKNIIFLKEKIRLALLRSQFSELFVQANLWLIAKNKDIKFLHQRIIEQYASLNSLNAEDFKLAELFYNRGKLLFVFRNEADIDKSMVAVLAYQERSCKQRLNEQVMINYLRNYPSIAKYLPPTVDKFNFSGYDIFTMHECQGVTIDSDSRYLPGMTKNIGQVLLDISLVSQKSVSERPEPVSWLNIIRSRMPGHDNKIDELKKFVSQYSSNVSVVMHGDAKIENFVLNKEHHVAGIIDWEQGIVNGFPLLDLYYLFVYNYQLKNNTDFYHAFRALSESNIPVYEQNILQKYCHEMKLGTKDRSYLLVVFFIHHYSCRYDVGPDTGNVWNVFRSSLDTALNLARRHCHG